MKKSLLSAVSAAVLVSTGILLSCGQTKSKNLAETTRVMIRFSRGPVTVLNADGVKSAARPGVSLGAGDSIFTGKNAAVELIVDTMGVMKVGSNASLVVTDLVKAGQNLAADFKLNSGSVLSAVQRLDKKDSFRVRTPTAVAGVRGTAFLTEVENLGAAIYPAGLGRMLRDLPKTTVSVLKGQVRLRDREGGEVDLDRMSRAIAGERNRLSRESVLPLSKDALAGMKEMLVMKSSEALSMNFVVRELSAYAPDIYGSEGGVRKDESGSTSAVLKKPLEKIEVKKKQQVLQETLDNEQLRIKPEKKW